MNEDNHPDEIPNKISPIKIHDEFQICGFFHEYRFLSNFHISPVWFEGILYPSSEAAYQAAKVPTKFRNQFLNITPAQTKKLWKTLPHLYTAEQWDSVKRGIMTRIVTEKFLSNDELKNQLLLTGDRYLEETNWWRDTYWGVFAEILPSGEIKKTGDNNLGEILMNVRDML